MKEFESDVLFNFTVKDGNLDEDKLLSGKLYVSNSNGISIEYTNSISNLKELFGNSTVQNMKSFTVYGQTVKGKKFTAYQCHKGNTNTSASNGSLITETGEIRIGTLFLGAYLEDIDNTKINSAKVRFSYLEHWLHKFNINDTFVDKSIESFTIPLNQFSNNMNVMLDDNITLETSRNWERKVDFNRKLTFDIQQFIKYGFNKPVSLQSYNELNFKLQNFFRLMLPNKNIFMEEQHIMVEDKNIEVYNSDKYYVDENNKVSWVDFLYIYDESNINDILVNWFNNQEEYGRVFNVLSSILDEPPFMYLEHKFLNLAQWYEGYCRLKYPATDNEVTQFKDQIEKIITQIAEEEDKELIQDITQYKYERPLKKQLKRLFDDVELKQILNINSSGQKSLIHYIGEYRNRLTHPEKKSDFDFQQLAYLTETLKYIILIILIKTLKLNDGTHAVNDIKNQLKDYYSKFIDTKIED